MVASFKKNNNSQEHSIEPETQRDNIMVMSAQTRPDESGDMLSAELADDATSLLVNAVDLLIKSHSGIQSFRELNNLYDLISRKLECSAHADVETEQKQEQEYLRLHLAKERLVSFALSLQIEGLEDVKDKLDFWYKIAISEMCEDDLSLTDHFIVSIHEYLAA